MICLSVISGNGNHLSRDKKSFNSKLPKSVRSSRTTTKAKEPKRFCLKNTTQEAICRELATRRCRVTKIIQVEATAYSLGDGSANGPLTTSETVPCFGTVAVDPRVIPLGTEMYIPEYGWCIARDTGKKIKGNRIDLYFEKVAKAIRFGRQRKSVYIIVHPSDTIAKIALPYPFPSPLVWGMGIF